MQNLTVIEYILSQMPRMEVFRASDIPEFGTLRVHYKSRRSTKVTYVKITGFKAQGFRVFGISDV